MKDAFTNWRTASDGDLEVTEPTAAIQIGAAGMVGHKGFIHVPEGDGDAPTLNITIEQSATEDGTYTTFATIEEIDEADDRAFDLANILPWVRFVLTVGGTTPNFGAVHVGLDKGAHQNVLTVGD